MIGQKARLTGSPPSAALLTASAFWLTIMATSVLPLLAFKLLRSMVTSAPFTKHSALTGSPTYTGPPRRRAAEPIWGSRGGLRRCRGTRLGRTAALADLESNRPCPSKNESAGDWKNETLMT